MITDELKRALERAAQQPEAEQLALAHMLNEAIDAVSKWEELLRDPRGISVLEQMAEEAHENYLRGETHALEELFTARDEPDDELP